VNSIINPPYKFMPSDPGIFVEIYLPKKTDFQPTLYSTLAKGFQIDLVKKHFELPEKASGIKSLLEHYQDSVQYLELDLADFPSVLHGYSMYEVDGVFYNSQTQQIQEERTQVLRIMFTPPLDSLLDKYQGEENRKQINRTTKDFLRFPAGRRTFKIERQLTEMQIELVDYLEKWTDFVGLFLFGFLVYEICEQITRLCSEGRMHWDKAEDEIWVTSFWNLVINPIKLVSVSDASEVDSCNNNLVS
jgi:hypothetical protein